MRTLVAASNEGVTICEFHDIDEWNTRRRLVFSKNLDDRAVDDESRSAPANLTNGVLHVFHPVQE